MITDRFIQSAPASRAAKSALLEDPRQYLQRKQTNTTHRVSAWATLKPRSKPQSKPKKAPAASATDKKRKCSGSGSRAIEQQTRHSKKSKPGMPSSRHIRMTDLRLCPIEPAIRARSHRSYRAPRIDIDETDHDDREYNEDGEDEDRRDSHGSKFGDELGDATGSSEERCDDEPEVPLDVLTVEVKDIVLMLRQRMTHRVFYVVFRRPR